MKKMLFLAAIAAFTLGSCSKDETVSGVDAPSSGEAIGFRTYIDKSDAETKATLTSVNTMSNFTLNAKKWSTNAATFDFMDFFSVTRNQSTTSYEYHPVKYYPSSSGDGVSFFAYSPAGSRNSSRMTTAVVLTGSAPLGALAKATLSYTVPILYVDGSVEQEDFLVAAVKQSSGLVALKFFHALSALSFRATNLSTDAVFVVHKIELLGFDNTGTLSLTPHTTAGTTDLTYSWGSNTTYDQTYEVLLPSSGVSILPAKLGGGLATTTDLLPANQKIMMLPQPLEGRDTGAGSLTNTAPADVANKSYVAVTYSSFDGDMTLTHTKDVKYFPIPVGLAATGFAKNTKYIFTYSFSVEAGTPVVIGTISMGGWAEPDVTVPLN